VWHKHDDADDFFLNRSTEDWHSEVLL
jgi:hypothetical protein